MAEEASTEKRNGFRFNGEIGLGSIINFVVLVGGIMGFMLNYEHRITVVEAEKQIQITRDANQDLALSTAIANMNANFNSIRDNVDKLVTMVK